MYDNRRVYPYIQWDILPLVDPSHIYLLHPAHNIFNYHVYILDHGICYNRYPEGIDALAHPCSWLVIHSQLIYEIFTIVLEDTYKTLLSIYEYDSCKKPPSRSEVLLCDQYTGRQQVNLIKSFVLFQ